MFYAILFRSGKFEEYLESGLLLLDGKEKIIIRLYWHLFQITYTGKKINILLQMYWRIILLISMNIMLKIFTAGYMLILM